MRIVIAAALVAAMASPALAQGAPASAAERHENTVGTPQKPTTWSPPAGTEQGAQAAPAPQQPVIKKGACASPPPRAATPKGGGGAPPCARH